MWPLPKKPEPAVPVVKPPSIRAQDRFVDGDMVILRDVNPYKGSIRAEKPYQILCAFYDSIRLQADNGTIGWFYHTHFDKWDGVGRALPMDSSREYEEAMQAQELMGL